MALKNIIALSILMLLGYVYLTDSAQEEQSITVFAASSLTDALTEIAEQYEQQHPGVSVQLEFNGSSTLAAQIGRGAPADVFASADQNQVQKLIDAGLVEQTSVSDFTRNTLTIIVPANNPAGIKSLEDLTRPDLLLILAAPEVPIRAYTDALLKSIDMTDSGYFDAVIANLVSEELNVRQIVAKIQLGEGDAGIVYASDVTPEIQDKIVSIHIPPEINLVASYPVAPVMTSRQPLLAQDFIQFILSEEAQDILVKWGFCTVITDSPEATPEPDETDFEPQTPPC